MDNSFFAEKLKDLRRKNKLTQKELSEKTDISYSSIVSYENGLRQPNAKSLAALERFFGVSADELLGNFMYKKAFPENLKKLRQMQGLTQKGLAEKIGVSCSAIISYENAISQPNAESLAALERFFNVSADELLGNGQACEQFQNTALISVVQTLESAYSTAAPEQQELAIGILRAAADMVEESVLNGEENCDISAAEIRKLLTAYTQINQLGRKALLERAGELTQLEKYKRGDSSEVN